MQTHRHHAGTRLTRRVIAATAVTLLAGLAGLVGSGCSSTPRASATSVDEETRTISVSEALADFDAAWQLVNDTHFDPDFNGVDWASVREELRPAAAEARNRSQLRAVIQDMLSRLNQSHFGIIPAEASPLPEDAASAPDGDAPSPRGEVSDGGASSLDAVVRNGDGQGDASPGIDLRLIDGQFVVRSVREGSAADRAGVRMGWVLSRIRDHETADVLEQLRETLSDNEMRIYALRSLDPLLLGREGSTVELTFLDGEDREVVLELQREPAPGEHVQFGNLPPMSTHLEWSRESFVSETGEEAQIGIIRFNVFMIPIAPKFERAMYELRDCDGLIIDVRGNPGGVGMLAASLSRFLLSEEASLGTMTMRGAELSFNVRPVIVTTWGEQLDPFPGPVAILQDAGSASTSEVFAGGLQSLGRVKVFGSRSAGMALPAAMDRLPSGDVLLHAIADFVTSTGVRMEHDGVIPDVEVELTRADLLRGIDAPELAAKEWIARKAGTR